MKYTYSDRLNSVAEYYYSRKLNEIAKIETSGKKVINLAIGNPDLEPSTEAINSAISSLRMKNIHGYSNHRSSNELRESFSEWYRNLTGVSLDPKTQILPLLGSKEAILYISMAFANYGDEILIPNPGYPAYSNAALLAGCKVKHYDLKEELNWEPDVDKLEEMDLSKCRIMWVNFPHMPTGSNPKKRTVERIMEFASKNRIVLVHDNPYCQILNLEDPISILKSSGGMEGRLEIMSMSKAFNMAGWRVGVALGDSFLIDGLLRFKSNVDSGMFTPIQAGAIAALKNSQAWHDSRNKIYLERRALVQELVSLLGFTFLKDQSGLFVWAKAPSSIESVTNYVDELLSKCHIFVVPGSLFGTNGSRHVRVSLCAEVNVLEEALDRVKTFTSKIV